MELANYSTISQRLARFAREKAPCFWEDEAVRKIVRESFADCIGCIMTGAKEETSVKFADYVAGLDSRPESEVLGRPGFRTDPVNAAALCSIQGHVFDYDDISEALGGHPGIITIPAVLAVASKLPEISVGEAVKAYMIGVETGSTLAAGFPNGSISASWERTSLFGAVSSATACAYLLGLSEKELVDAYGIVISDISGFAINHGTANKDISAGRTCAKGLFAVQMAKIGMNARNNIFEGEKGFINAVKGCFDYAGFEAALAREESYFRTPGLITKVWPTCRETHSTIEAAQNIVRTHAVSAEEIEQVTVRLQRKAYLSCGMTQAESPREAKFNAAYCAALVFVNGCIKITDFIGDGAIKDLPALTFMRARIRVRCDKACDADGAEVIVRTKAGRVLSETVEKAVGCRKHPLQERDRINKFQACMDYIRYPKELRIILYSVMNDLDSGRSCAEYIESLNGLLNQSKGERI